MVDRNIKKVKEYLFSAAVNCYPPENQAAKIFAKWLQENPQYSVDDVDMCIDSFERMEDAYGNSGGYDYYMHIYRTREETKEKHNERIANEEEECYAKFRKSFSSDISRLVKEMNLYPTIEEIVKKKNEIVNDIMGIVRNHFKNNKNESIGAY